MNNNFKLKTYYAMAIDPIHVGMGGTRLGRVDNPIIRDPSTNIPKIPGSSFNGVTRYYAALQSNLDCAGKGGEFGEKHCGRCDVCLAFGFSNNKGSMQGLVHFFDAYIYLFPVASMKGTIWVCSPNSLGLNEKNYPADLDDKFITLGKFQGTDKLNFSWLLLEKYGGKENETNEKKNFINDAIPKTIRSRAVLVSDLLFSKIVNINLEVRTSVSIDPRTGAAEDRALFTYEAIPRTTIFKFDVLYRSHLNESKNLEQNSGNIHLGNNTVKNFEKVVEKGLSYIEFMGIGGMNTRGMGRMRIFKPNENPTNSNPKSVNTTTKKRGG